MLWIESTCEEGARAVAGDRRVQEAEQAGGDQDDRRPAWPSPSRCSCCSWVSQPPLRRTSRQIVP